MWYYWTWFWRSRSLSRSRDNEQWLMISILEQSFFTSSVPPNKWWCNLSDPTLLILVARKLGEGVLRFHWRRVRIFQKSYDQLHSHTSVEKQCSVCLFCFLIQWCGYSWYTRELVKKDMILDSIQLVCRVLFSLAVSVGWFGNFG